MTYEGCGRYRRLVTVRANDKAIRGIGQDGGTVTALLCHLLKAGEIDGAVLTNKADDRWTAGQCVATTEEEIRKAAGSIYALSPNLFQLKEAVRERALEKVAYVGLPCQAVAVRKLQLYPFGGRHVGDKIKLVVGIFCSENFPQESLRTIVEGYAGTPLEEMTKMRLSGGKFVVDGTRPGAVPVKKAMRWAQDGDHVCPDLTAEYADIAVGSIGSEPGWNTVFVRTKNGERLFEEVLSAGALETRDVGPEQPGLQLLEKLAVAKKARARETIEQRKQMGLFVTRDMFY